MKDDRHAAKIVLRAAPAPAEVAPAEPAITPAGDEQVAYANLLDATMKVGLLTLTAMFVAYVTGLLTPHVPVSDLPRYWSLPVKEHLAATGTHAGWSWLRMVHRGDFLNLLGVALLSGVTILCYAAIIPIFIRKGERTYAWLSFIEVVVLALAASGLLNVGAH